MDYTDFFTAEQVATYRHVKRGTMMLADVSREVVATMVGGTIPFEGKQFVHTKRGEFRLCTAANSDNSTERFAHREMNAKTVVMGDEIDLDAFFRDHGIKGGIALFKRTVRARLRRLP